LWVWGQNLETLVGLGTKWGIHTPCGFGDNIWGTQMPCGLGTQFGVFILLASFGIKTKEIHTPCGFCDKIRGILYSL